MIRGVYQSTRHASCVRIVTVFYVVRWIVSLAFCFCFNKGTMGALGGTIRFMPSGKFADDFVYFYARGAKLGGASSISILPGEDEFGLATLKAAPQPVQRWFVW